MTILDVLRGDPQSRPVADEAAAIALRTRIESWAAEREEALIVRAPRGEGHGLAPSAGRMRGILVHELVRLAAAGYDWRNPAADALSAWRANGPSALVEDLTRFDADERAQLRADLEAHAVVLRRTLGSLPPNWMPRSAVRSRVALASGRLLLADVVDLMAGIVGPRVSVALVDVTTSPLGPDAEDRLAYHALVQTLRTSRVPLASAMLSTATGDVLVRTVDDDVLEHAATYVRSCIEAT
jgi:hypothetical protein